MALPRYSTKNKKIQYCFDGISEQNCRPSNMDSLIILDRTIGSDYLLLAVVSDGVGSLEKGAFAATALTRGLLGWFSTLDTCKNIVDSLQAEIRSINEEIFTASSLQQFESAATVSILLIVNDKYYGLNAGDSRIYVMRGGVLTQMTRDDVSETGALTEYIGFEMPPHLQVYQGNTRDSLFLLCSDGLYKHMDSDLWIEQLAGCTEENLGHCINALVDRAIELGERDNISAAVIMDCTKGC